MPYQKTVLEAFVHIENAFESYLKKNCRPEWMKISDILTQDPKKRTQFSAYNFDALFIIFLMLNIEQFLRLFQKLI